ncbi:MAG: hypothetical protein M9921_01145 [Fimbriimonadaceae bacterium]|nr:hypothetical protein [Fimbriimonadaceae bacterium]
MSKTAPGIRYAEVEREAANVRVRVVLDLDGGTKRDLGTGVPFFDRMLALMAYQAMIDLGVQVDTGAPDDEHHTFEEVGIAMGEALQGALADGEAVNRIGSATVAKDDALVLVALDTSARGQLFWDVPFETERVADVGLQSIREFFRGIVLQGGLCAHVRKLAGENDHHVVEALFKAFGAALVVATQPLDRRPGTS